MRIYRTELVAAVLGSTLAACGSGDTEGTGAGTGGETSTSSSSQATTGPGAGGGGGGTGGGGMGGSNCVPVQIGAMDLHVSPTGTPQGDGSKAMPWDLTTALSANVPPGSTIWLHDGVYAGSFTSSLMGAPGMPIVVRGFPGEHPVLDGATNPNAAILSVNGAYTDYRDFEITNTETTRQIPDPGSNPPGARGPGIDAFGPNTRFIHLVVHDAGVGIGNWSPASDSEVYGCILFYNGWHGPDRGHGHGIYAQNVTGNKKLYDNVIFRQFSYGIHAYTEGGNIDNMDVEGNISFNSGEIEGDSTTTILIGGLQIAKSPILKDNATYFSMQAGSNQLGYGDPGGTDGAVVEGNYFFANNALSAQNCANIKSVAMNTFIGDASGIDPAMYPNNTFATSKPAATKVIVRPSAYEPGRANVAIYGWEGKAAVDVDLSSVLRAGDEFEVRDVQDLFGKPAVTGKYDGKPVPFPMDDVAVTMPIGNVPVVPPHTSPEFGAFVVRTLCPAPQ